MEVGIPRGSPVSVLVGEKMNTSQHGEEKYLRKFFKETKTGAAVEVGAGDGILLSNTLWMEKRGWRVMCIEPNAELYLKLEKNRACAVPAACSDVSGEQTLYRYETTKSSHHGVVTVIEPLSDEFRKTYTFSDGSYTTSGSVRSFRLDDLLDQYGFKSLDFVSIDVDGIEMKVLAGFDIARWNPAAVLVECTSESIRMRELFDSNGYFLAESFGGFNYLFLGESQE